MLAHHRDIDHIAGLFLGKAVLLGFVAAVFGVFVGMWSVLEFGPALFPVTKQAIKVNPVLAFQLVFATPLFAAFARSSSSDAIAPMTLFAAITCLIPPSNFS